jgi:HSP20 family protein
MAMLTSRTRISPLDRMTTLNRALDQAFNSAWSSDSRTWVPAIDVIETKDAYVLHVELPGVEASEIDMSFEKSVLTIRGTKKSQLEARDTGEIRVYAAERVSGSFERSIRLPDFVDGDRITAELTNGVLMVSVPKAEAAQPRRIEINSITSEGRSPTAANQP